MSDLHIPDGQQQPHEEMGEPVSAADTSTPSGEMEGSGGTQTELPDGEQTDEETTSPSGVEGCGVTGTEQG